MKKRGGSAQLLLKITYDYAELDQASAKEVALKCGQQP
jgi:hypothetical protein